MNNRPVIGITVDSSDDDALYVSPIEYAAAVERAGGLPLLSPYRADPGAPFELLVKKAGSW